MERSLDPPKIPSVPTSTQHSEPQTSLAPISFNSKMIYSIAAVLVSMVIPVMFFVAWVIFLDTILPARTEAIPILTEHRYKASRQFKLTLLTVLGYRIVTRHDNLTNFILKLDTALGGVSGGEIFTENQRRGLRRYTLK